MGALRRAKIDEKDRFLGIQADGAAATDIKPSEITVSGGAHLCVVVVVIAFDCGVLDGPVHPLDLCRQPASGTANGFRLRIPPFAPALCW